MVAHWMLYCLLVGCCFGVAAHAGETLLRMFGRQGRWVWMLALLLSVALPLINYGFPNLLAGSVVNSTLDDGARTMVGVLMPGILVQAPSETQYAALFNSFLLLFWIVLSLSLLSLIAWTTVKLINERRFWREEKVGGRGVLVSTNVGPAVIGVLEHTIVVPCWLLDLDEEEQRLAVLHESEHARAGDIWLLFCGLMTLVLLPWNVAIWWQLRRLRLAVEADCDARVLSSGTSAHSYSSFLLNVCSKAQKPKATALALSERKSPLLRRIEMMTRKTRWTFVRGGLYVALLGVFLTLACETPAPLESDMSDASSPPPPALDARAADLDQPPSRLSGPPPIYPELMKKAGIGARIVATLIVGIDGKVEPGSVEIVESSNEAFNGPAISMMSGTRWQPALVDGEPVRTVVQCPMEFWVEDDEGWIRYSES